MTLYRPEAFEPLTDTEWSEEKARAGIREIVADTEAAFRGPKLFWRAHEWDGWHSTSPMKNLYVGTAGVLWALHRLEWQGYAESSLDLQELAATNVELFRRRPDYMKGIELPTPREGALLTGETGVLLTGRRLGLHDFDDDLYALVRANIDNEAEEVMWGAPGTLFAALAMCDMTNEDRWRRARDETTTALLARRNEDGSWTQRIHGEDYRGLTPPHGLVGNVQVLLRALGDPDREPAFQAAAILRDTAVVEDGLVNWPSRMHPRGELRVQWCTGSPGVVVSAYQYLDEELFLAGAELPWRTGPPSLEKGPGICHGAAGNGYAFLKAYWRTTHELWLDRARRFAMHALEQVRRLRAQRGRGRYSLWTGDPGVALYLADCISGTGIYPVLDEFY
jgi:Lanthionine synthetase C-like protein